MYRECHKSLGRPAGRAGPRSQALAGGRAALVAAPLLALGPATSSTTGMISPSLPARGTVMFRVSGGRTGTVSSGEIHAVRAGTCLDVSGSSTTAGTKVQVCSGNGQSNERWSLG